MSSVGVVVTFQGVQVMLTLGVPTSADNSLIAITGGVAGVVILLLIAIVTGCTIILIRLKFRLSSKL